MSRQSTPTTKQMKAAQKAGRAERRGSTVPASILGPRVLILLSVLALLMIGLVMVYSSSSIVALYKQDNSEIDFFKQVIFVLIGIVGCFVVWRIIPYHLWTGPLVWIVWAVALVLLVATMVMGNEGYGAQRWIDLGPVGIQPAEFAKIAFLLMAVRILMMFRNGEITFKGMAIQAFVLVLIPLMFMYRSQSDLGTTLICFVGILAIMWLGEVPLKVMLAIVGAGVIFAIVASTVGYRSERFLFLNPWDDGENGLGNGYQLVHSYYALAQGGLFGEGLGNSREKFLYLPFPETDFIFAIIGEELGLVGALTVVVLFLVFLLAGMRIAQGAADDVGTLIAGGFTVMLCAQAFLNIGCAIGVLPTTGKPLPFISAGGSSMIASLLMLGFILSVSQSSGAPSIYEKRRDDLRVVRAYSNASPSSGRSGSRSGGSPSSRSAKRSSESSRRNSSRDSNRAPARSRGR